MNSVLRKTHGCIKFPSRKRSFSGDRRWWAARGDGSSRREESIDPYWGKFNRSVCWMEGLVIRWIFVSRWKSMQTRHFISLLPNFWKRIKQYLLKLLRIRACYRWEGWNHWVASSSICSWPFCRFYLLFSFNIETFIILAETSPWRSRPSLKSA